MRRVGVLLPVGHVAVLTLAVLIVVAVSGCSRTVTGVPAAVPSPQAATSAGPTGVPAPQVPTSAGPDPPPGPAVLQPDVLADECLLDAAQLAALLGRPVGTPQQIVVSRDDGSRSSSCYVTAGRPGDTAGRDDPLAAVNVYRVRTGSPAQFVRAAAPAGRALSKVGEAAVVLETVAGPTLQVASARFLVTVVVHDGALEDGPPSDKAWRAAARAALARLPD